MHVGPTVQSFNLSAASPLGANYTRVEVSFTSATATATIHFAGTAACGACCAESPFEVALASAGGSAWVRSNFTLPAGGNTVYADVPLASATDKVVGLRFDWEGYPQCALCVVVVMN